MIEIEIENAGKIFWPATGTTKGELIAYDLAVAPALVAHVAGRALTTARFPDGVLGPGWYETRCRGAPPWLRLVPPHGMPVVEDRAALVWLAARGAVELHPFLAPADRPDAPHAVVFDLDPGPPAGLAEAARVALLVRDAVGGLRAYPKTSGRKGLHVYVPVEGATFADTKAFAREVAVRLAARVPELVAPTIARAPRAGRVYIDWAQNSARRSTIAAWSPRATPRPGVSTPLSWAEVEAGLLGPFSLEEARARYERDGDLFAPVLEGGQRL